MTIQNYLIIESNVVNNICVWDGDTSTWTPPVDATMLVQSTTPALVWVLNSTKDGWILGEQIGVGSIGFTWDTTTQVLTTNEPQPAPPKPQPNTTGTVTA